MDRHDIAHYAIAAALTLGGGGAVIHQAQTPPVLVNATHVSRASAHVWPPLSDAQIGKLTAQFKTLGIPALSIYCLDARCADIAEDFTKAAEDAGIVVANEVSVTGVPDGFSVGAINQNAAENIAIAMVDGTGAEVNPRLARESYKTPYIAFGKRER